MLRGALMDAVPVAVVPAGAEDEAKTGRIVRARMTEVRFSGVRSLPEKCLRIVFADFAELWVVQGSERLVYAATVSKRSSGSSSSGRVSADCKRLSSCCNIPDADSRSDLTLEGSGRGSSWSFGIHSSAEGGTLSLKTRVLREGASLAWSSVSLVPNAEKKGPTLEHHPPPPQSSQSSVCLSPCLLVLMMFVCKMG